MKFMTRAPLAFALALAVTLPVSAQGRPEATAATQAVAAAELPEAPVEGRGRAVTRWLFAQLLPSLELTHGSHGSAWGLGWEVTPLAVGFGGDSPQLRAIYVEPGLRHHGTVELAVAGDYFDLRGGDVNGRARFAFRAGVRTYLPLGRVAPHTSLSLGLAYYDGFDRRGLLYETGLNLFDERVGLRFAFVAHSTDPQYIWSFRIQSF